MYENIGFIAKLFFQRVSCISFSVNLFKCECGFYVVSGISLHFQTCKFRGLKAHNAEWFRWVSGAFLVPKDWLPKKGNIKCLMDQEDSKKGLDIMGIGYK